MGHERPEMISHHVYSQTCCSDMMNSQIARGTDRHQDRVSRNFRMTSSFCWFQSNLCIDRDTYLYLLYRLFRLGVGVLSLCHHRFGSVFFPGSCHGSCIDRHYLQFSLCILWICECRQSGICIVCKSTGRGVESMDFLRILGNEHQRILKHVPGSRRRRICEFQVQI